MKLKLLILTAVLALLACLWWAVQHRTTKLTPIAQQAGAPAVENAELRASAYRGKMPVVAVKPDRISTPSTGISSKSAADIVTDTQALYEDRFNAIKMLSARLTTGDWKVLQKFLLNASAQDQDQMEQVVKNRLLDLLCALDPPPDDLGNTLVQMYRDHEQNGVIRDYAVQHLGAYYEQMAAQDASADTMQAVQNILWEATGETSDSIAGTALLALKRLSQEYGDEFDQNKIAATALQMAGSTSSGELTHITAYQVCAQMGAKDALPLLVQAAQNGETTAVRISAIGALGLLGQSDQIPFLQSFLQTNEKRLRPAAQHALEQLMVRNN